MLCQPPQIARQPYIKLLSTLRKPESIWLCTEFDLPINGSVLNLRDQAKHHLIQNAKILYRNPRFKPLYPRIQRINHPPSLPICSHNQSMRSPSPVTSFESWHSIKEPDQQPSPHLEDPQQPFHPPGQHLSPISQHYIPSAELQEPYFLPDPLPAPTFTNSIKDSPLPVNHLYNGHKFLIPPTSLLVS